MVSTDRKGFHPTKQTKRISECSFTFETVPQKIMFNITIRQIIVVTTNIDQATKLTVTTSIDPSVCLPTRHPPSPNALRTPGLLDVVHQDRGDLELPARQ